MDVHDGLQPLSMCVYKMSSETPHLPGSPMEMTDLASLKAVIALDVLTNAGISHTTTTAPISRFFLSDSVIPSEPILPSYWQFAWATTAKALWSLQIRNEKSTIQIKQLSTIWSAGGILNQKCHWAGNSRSNGQYTSRALQPQNLQKYTLDAHITWSKLLGIS